MGYGGCWQPLKFGEGREMAEIIQFRRFRADLSVREDDDAPPPVFDVFNHGHEHPIHPANKAKDRNNGNAEQTAN